jgi:hypothetical protein
MVFYLDLEAEAVMLVTELMMLRGN